MKASFRKSSKMLYSFIFCRLKSTDYLGSQSKMMNSSKLNKVYGRMAG